MPTVSFMSRLLAALFLALSLTGTAWADAAPGAPTQAHPTLWKVTGRQSTVYLLGSVHVLSATLHWRDARIDQAVRDADGFFFETALDPKAIAGYVAEHGSLPQGQSLRAMLPPDAQKNLGDD